MKKDMNELIRMSRFYGENTDMIQAGGGNTSFKAGDVMCVKASGKNLKEVQSEEDFVTVDLVGIGSILADNTLSGLDDNERDVIISTKLLAARTEATVNRPSIETFLHALIDRKFVVHTHPVYVNAMTCSADGHEIALKLFSRSDYVWIPYKKPGYPVACVLDEAISGHYTEFGTRPVLVFMQNHGLIAAGDSFEEINGLTEKTISPIREYFSGYDAPDKDAEINTVNGKIMTVLEKALNERLPGAGSDLKWSRCPYVTMLSKGNLKNIALSGAFSPDHIVYCGEEPLLLGAEDSLKAVSGKVSDFTERLGYGPRYFIVSGEGVIILGSNEREIAAREEILRTHIKTLMLVLRKSRPVFLGGDECRYLAHWESEKFRQKLLKKAGSDEARR